MSDVHPDPDTLLAALCFMMTRYALHPSPLWAAGIIQHLEMLLVHPSTPGGPWASAARGLLHDWRRLFAADTSTPRAGGRADAASVH
jgi:hypothetical protein